MTARFVLAALAVASVTSTAQASCFCMLRRPVERSLVADESYSPSSAVFVLRDGTRTVVTIEAAYRGPAVELSMVIPVPTSISRDDVRTVSGTVFRRLDRHTAPRVRHVWPDCSRRPRTMPSGSVFGSAHGRRRAGAMFEDDGVVIEDQWAVDEYDVTMLSASESAGLLTFLRARGLDLPDRAVSVLRGYIETGHRFVLAKVNPSRAHRLGDAMVLSPIQLEYESTELRVPVRLGTLNSPGEQELLLYVLSPEGRYELANRPNEVAPTDILLRPDIGGSFADLYRGISDAIFQRTPGAAITEYAHRLGFHVPRTEVRELGLADERGRRSRTWTLTRIRHRYGKDLSDDLTLRPAPPLRLFRRWSEPGLWTPGGHGQNAFHVRYVVRHDACPGPGAQRRIANRWATSESMSSGSDDIWPGQAILEPIPSLGIEPGSSPPPGWPPHPAESEPQPAAPSPGQAPEPPAAAATATPATATPAPPAASPPASPPAAPSDSGLCAAAPGRGPGSAILLMLGVAALALLTRRARR